MPNEYRSGSLRIPLAAGEGAGGVAAVANPEGKTLIVTSLAIHTTTKSTGASTADAGIAANGTTSNDGLIDGVDLGTAAGTFSNGTNPGTNGKPHQVWGPTQYLTISKATGAVAGLVGFAYVKYMVIDTDTNE